VIPPSPSAHLSRTLRIGWLAASAFICALVADRAHGQPAKEINQQAQLRALPSLVLSDEVLLQFGSGIVLNTFDQNRLFAGLKKSLSRSWSFDLGYMLVYQQKPSGFQYDLNHTVRWFFYLSPDLRPVKSAHEPAGGEE
jgi:hypothetical protein